MTQDERRGGKILSGPFVSCHVESVLVVDVTRRCYNTTCVEPSWEHDWPGIIYRMSEILFATEIAFRRLDGCMPQQELNLFKLSSTVMTQLCTGPPQIVGCNMLQARSLAAGLDHVPHNILRHAFPPYLSGPGDCSKNSSLRDPRCRRPLIERGLHP